MLEDVLQRNNELLSTHNQLLTQLLAKMDLSVATSVTVNPSPKETKETAAVIEKAPLDLALLAAFAVLYPTEHDVSAERLTEAEAIKNKEGDQDTVKKSNSLYVSLTSVTQVNHMNSSIALEIAQIMVKHWDEIEGHQARVRFIEKLLDTPQAERTNISPNKKKGEKAATKPVVPTVPKKEGEELTPDLRKEAGDLILVLARRSRDDALAVLGLFGAKKLTEIPDEKLADVIAAAEQSLGV